MADNSAGNFDYGWLGQAQRGLEHAPGIATIEMGARPYVPGMGRFLGVDPVEGGSANDYDYSNADPINQFDPSGLGPCPPFLHRTREDGSHYCKGSAAASPVKEVYRHTEISVSVCAIRCVGVGTQGGTVYRQTGWGCCVVGGNIGYAPRQYGDRACNTAGGSVSVGGYGTYSEMGLYEDPKEILAPSGDFAGGWSPGFGAGPVGMTNRDVLGERFC